MFGAILRMQRSWNYRQAGDFQTTGSINSHSSNTRVRGHVHETEHKMLYFDPCASVRTAPLVKKMDSSELSGLFADYLERAMGICRCSARKQENKK
jgi:hypothetical protein